jgi:hypothetical membrane protein
MKRSIQQGLAICGITGPILFTIVLIILSFLQPEYNHITQYLSEFGAVNAPNAVIMNTLGFPLLGVLIIAFAFALDQGVNYGNDSKVGPILVVISGISFVLCGIFICDPGCVAITTIGVIHGYMCFIAQFALIIAVLPTSQRLKNDNRWGSYLPYSLITFILGFSFAAVYKLNVFENLIGLLQRVSFGIPLFWVEIMSIKLLRLFKTQSD